MPSPCRARGWRLTPWHIRVVVWVAAACGAATIVTAQLSQSLPDRQLPIFRADSHFVRVDAYPTAKDGSIIRNLTAQDFEITEDGKSQIVDSAEYIEYERWSPGDDPPEVETQRDSFRLAADPRYRVVVVYVNRLSRTNARYVERPLIDLLTREVGPRDLYGLLLPHNEASDLVLGKFTPAEQARLTRFLSVLDHNSPFDMDPVEQQVLACFGQAGVRRWRLDNLYRDLEGIIAILGTLRDERKSLIFVTEGIPGANGRAGRGGGGGGQSSYPPQAQPLVTRRLPGSTGLASGTFNPDEGVHVCELLGRDMPPEIPDRFLELIRLARQSNVAIHPINPTGITMNTTVFSGSALRRMADETGGIAVVNSNDIKSGFERIKNDMPAYYLLGYYTSNTKWDGKRREIKVRLKSTGKTIRARREYQSPTEADVAAMRAAAAAPALPPGPTPIESALSGLARLRNDVALQVQGAVREGELALAVEVPLDTAASGGWYEGATVEAFVVSDDRDAPADAASMTGTARMLAGARGAEVRLPISVGDAGPWQVRVVVRRGTDTLEDRTQVTHEVGSTFGRPLLYRAASPPAAPYIPVADQQFLRQERLRAEWLVASPTPVRMKARLLQTTGHASNYSPPVVTEERGDFTLARVDMTLTSIAAGDYLLELVAEANGEEQSTLLAIRVLR